MLCDGSPDCPDGEDEELCNVFKCTGLLRCRGDDICVHPIDICDGVIHCLLSGDDENLCDMLTCPMECICRGTAVKCITLDSIYQISFSITALILQQYKVTKKASLGYFHNILNLHMSRCTFSANSIDQSTFGSISDILTLQIINSGVQYIRIKSFDTMTKLSSIDIHHNEIHEIYSYSFQGLQSLKQLNLSHFKITTLYELSFCGMSQLQLLDLSYNYIHVVKQASFLGVDALRTIDLRQNEILFMDSLEMHQHMSIYVDSVEYCCALDERLSCYINSVCHKVQHCDAMTKATPLNIINISISSLLFIVMVAVLSFRTRRVKLSYTHKSIIIHLSVANFILMLFAMILNSVIIFNSNEVIYLNKTWLKSYGCYILNFMYFCGYVSSNLFTFLLVLDQCIAVFFIFRQVWISSVVYCQLGLWVLILVLAFVQLHLTPNSNATCMSFLVTSHSTAQSLLFTICALVITAVLIIGMPLMYQLIVCKVKASNKRVSNKKASNNQKKIILKSIFTTTTAALTWLALLSVVLYAYIHPKDNDNITVLSSMFIHTSCLLHSLFISQKFAVLPEIHLHN